MAQFVALLMVLIIPVMAMEEKAGVRFFPGNENYGFIKMTNAKFPCPTDYLIVKAISGNKSTPYSAIDTIQSTVPPQLCDSNAISFIIMRNDSAFLATSILWPNRTKDTSISLIGLNGHICGGGDDESDKLLTLNRVNQYCYLLKDSIIAWRFSVKEEFFAIGKLEASGDVRIIIDGMFADGPFLTNDFTQILFSIPYDKINIDFNYHGSRILAYDIALKDTVSLFESEKGAYGANRRCRNCAIYYFISSDSDDAFDFCRANGDSIVYLAHFKRPIAIADYYLYSDSIIILTSNCCDSTYGIKSQIIIDSGR